MADPTQPVLGQQITIPPHNHVVYPVIVMAKSSFCSNCLFSRKLLLNHFNQSKIDRNHFFEFDIASDPKLTNLFAPLSIPSFYLIDKNQKLVAKVEERLTEKTAGWLVHLLQKLI